MSQNTLQQDIAQFFRQFALEVLRKANVDPNNPQAFKMAMVDHFEEIYPRFAMTAVFQEHNEKARHEEMVEEYKRCFTLLLQGTLP